MADFQQANPTTWDHALQWLHSLQPQPPHYRTNIWRKLPHQARVTYFQLLHKIYNWILAATEPHPHAQPHLASSVPFWNLLITFDMMLLAPKPQDCHLSPAALLRTRLQLFKQGHLPQLYHQALQPQTQAHATHQPEDAANQHAAQLAADEDNYTTAYARITKALPVASISPEIRAACLKLYPPPTTYQPTTTKPRLPPTTQPLQVDPSLLISTLRHLKKGTAAGPYGDLPETTKAFALYQPKYSDSLPYIQPFTKVIQLILNGNLPHAIGTSLASNYFMALHKDPADHTKLRPIGMGMALRRIAGKYLMEHFRAQLATYMLPFGQFAIALKGGLQCMVDSIRAQVHRTVSGPNQTRVLLLLDIKNMFNSVSRAAVRDFLATHPDFKTMLPFYDLLYGQPNKCFYFDDQDELQYFLQEEGHAQGCPVAPTMSVFELCLLVTTLHRILQALAEVRRLKGHLGDDGQGTEGTIMSYMDDTFVLLAPEDVQPFLAAFQASGAPLGIELNFTKTRLLTTTTGHPSQDPKVHQALHYISSQAPQPFNPEITTGVRILGQPVGSTQFANDFLLDTASAFATNLLRLANSHTDIHTKALLFYACALPSIQHLFASDVYYNADPATFTPQQLFSWSSPFQQTISNATHAFMTVLANQPTDLPPHSYAIAHHPVAQGGLSLREPAIVAYTAFIISTTRSLRYATHGVPLPYSTTEATIALPTPIARSLATWQKSTTNLPLYTIYKAVAPALFPHITAAHPQSTPCTTLTQLVKSTNLQGLASTIYTTHTTTQLEDLQLQGPPEVTTVLPSLLSHYTSLPLRSFNRRFPHNRLSNDTYQLLLQRKLRIPCLPPHLQGTTCPKCKHPLDAYGDHFFRCTYSKMALSNGIRDTLFHICTHLSTAADFTTSKHHVTCETQGLLPHPQFQGQRPADVGLQLTQAAIHPSPPFPASFLAIDVTVTSPPVAPGVRPDPQINPIHKVHLHSLRSKLQSKLNVDAPTYFTALLHAGIILLPFTVDPFGGLGHFAHTFLYGSHHAPPPPPPNWIDSLSPHATHAYQQLLSAPKALLPKANRKYTAPLSHSVSAVPFSPSRWAHQTIALNLSIHLASHLHKAMTAASKSILDSGAIPGSVAATPLYATYDQPVLDPFPYFLQPALL